LKKNLAMKPVVLHSHTLPLGPIHATGTVSAVAADAVAVRLKSGLVQARRAASCLMEPAPGDQVLVSGEDASDCYVIAVLARDSTTPCRLHLSGDTHLQVNDGALHLGADHGLRLAGGPSLHLSAAEIDLQSAKTQLITGQLTVIGRALTATLDHIGLVGNRVEAVFKSLLQRLSHSVREVEGVDHLRCGQIDYRAEENASVRGKNTLLTARELVKIDGGQIHLG
jgi:hypothetical protein